MWLPHPLGNTLVTGQAAKDFSASPIDGTWTGNLDAPTTAFGRPSWTFTSGGGTQILMGNVHGITTTITLSMWLRTTSMTQAYAKGITKGQDSAYTLQANHNSTGPSCRIWATGVGEATSGALSTVTNGVPHLLTGTYDGANARIYIDGKQAGIAACTGSIRTTSESLTIGREPPGFAGAGLDGTAWDFRLYNRALTADEVWQLYDPATRFELWARSPLQVARLMTPVPPDYDQVAFRIYTDTGTGLGEAA